MLGSKISGGAQQSNELSPSRIRTLPRRSSRRVRPCIFRCTAPRALIIEKREWWAAANSQPRRILQGVTRVTMGDMPDDEIDFSNNVRTVVTGRGLSLGANDEVKIELCPNKGESVAVANKYWNSDRK